MPSLSVLIKPASGLCNMRCRYCFYADEVNRRKISSYGIMSEKVSEALIKRAFDFADGTVTFAFQGGEPTLAGEEYYRGFTEAVQCYNTKKLPVSYAMQTNGYELSDGLCELLRDNHFLLGVSLDGNSAVHDELRRGADENGTFKRVGETIARLKSFGIEYNILTVVTDSVAKNISRIYPYFKSRNFKYLQFIKYINGLGETGETFAPSQKRYASFLNTAFGYYYDDFMSGNYISVREFDNFVMLAAGMRAECCGMNGSCPNNLVIEADGGAYPCDFYVLDEWRMGSIVDASIEKLFASEISKRFIERSRIIPEKCKKCKYYRLCFGGCARYRDFGSEALEHFEYCESYLEFFERNSNKILKLAQYARGRMI